MKFLAAVFEALSKLFPFQMGMFIERTVSVVMVLEANKLTYSGNFTKDSEMNVTAIGKLDEGEHFTVAGHAVEVAKVYDDNVDAADWVNYLDASGFSDAEKSQLRQIFSQATKLQFFYGNDSNKVPMGTGTDRYLATEPSMGTVGNFHRFIPNFTPYNINGDGDTPTKRFIRRYFSCLGRGIWSN